LPVATARQSRAGTQRLQLRDSNLTVHRRHATVGAGTDPFLRDVFRRLGDQVGDLFRRLDAVARNVDDPDQDILPGQQLEQAQGHVRVHALERDLVETAL